MSVCQSDSRASPDSHGLISISITLYVPVASLHAMYAEAIATIEATAMDMKVHLTADGAVMWRVSEIMSYVNLTLKQARKSGDLQ